MRVLIAVALLMMLCGAVAQRITQPAKQEKAQPANLQSTGTGTLTVFNPQPGNFTLFGLNGKVLVTIHLDGTIEYGKDYTPDKAAKVFWEALGRDMPCKELRKR